MTSTTCVTSMCLWPLCMWPPTMNSPGWLFGSSCTFSLLLALYRRRTSIGHYLIISSDFFLTGDEGGRLLYPIVPLCHYSQTKKSTQMKLDRHIKWYNKYLPGRDTAVEILPTRLLKNKPNLAAIPRSLSTGTKSCTDPTKVECSSLSPSWRLAWTEVSGEQSPIGRFAVHCVVSDTVVRESCKKNRQLSGVNFTHARNFPFIFNMHVLKFLQDSLKPQ